MPLPGGLSDRETCLRAVPGMAFQPMPNWYKTADGKIFTKLPAAPPAPIQQQRRGKAEQPRVHRPRDNRGQNANEPRATAKSRAVLAREPAVVRALAARAARKSGFA